VIASFINLLKIMVLISFELSLPLSLALNRMLLDLGPKQVLVIVSIHVSSRIPMGYLLPDEMEAFPYQNVRTNRQ
jgi:hypothetical protein